MTLQELRHRAFVFRLCDLNCNCKNIVLDIICPNMVRKQISHALAENAILLAWDFREGNDGFAWFDEKEHLKYAIEEYATEYLIYDNGNDVVSEVYRRGSFVFEGKELFFLEIVFGGCCRKNWELEFMVCAYTSKSARNKGEEQVRRLRRKRRVRVRCRMCMSARERKRKCVRFDLWENCDIK